MATESSGSKTEQTFEVESFFQMFNEETASSKEVVLIDIRESWKQFDED